jgi:hypothetical protein
MGTELSDNLDRKRHPGGYIWRDKLGDAEVLLMDVKVAEDDSATRAKLRKVFDILRELEHYRCGGGD